MNDVLAQKIKGGTERYPRDIPVLLDGKTRTVSQPTRLYEAHMLQHLANIAGSPGEKPQDMTEGALWRDNPPGTGSPTFPV